MFEDIEIDDATLCDLRNPKNNNPTAWPSLYKKIETALANGKKFSIFSFITTVDSKGKRIPLLEITSLDEFHKRYPNPNLPS